jgi:hypothetical protein
MKLKPHQRVSIEIAEERALSAMQYDQLNPASHIAASIWPDHKMTGQGAGAAASRILKRLEKRGLCKWTVKGEWWGWCRT